MRIPRIRTTHRSLGLLLLLPMIGWAVTGMIFFIKPGYDAAYEQLTVKTYPLVHATNFDAGQSQKWQSVKLLRSKLGVHALVATSGGMIHLDGEGGLWPAPTPQEIAVLVDDAIAFNRARYGTIERVSDGVVYTSTGIEIALDWNTLSLHQHGTDRTVIDALYKLHYLQWTPWDGVNRVLGFAGLIALIALTLSGLRILLRL